MVVTGWASSALPPPKPRRHLRTNGQSNHLPGLRVEVADIICGNINRSDPGPNAVSGTALLAQNNFDFPIFIGPSGCEYGVQQQVKVEAFGVFSTTCPEVQMAQTS